MQSLQNEVSLLRTQLKARNVDVPTQPLNSLETQIEPIRKKRRVNEGVRLKDFLGEVDDIRRFLPKPEFEANPLATELKAVLKYETITPSEINLAIELGDGGSIIHLSIPSLDHTIECYNAFDWYLGTCFYFLNPATFKSEVRDVYASIFNAGSKGLPLSREDVLFYGCILLVIATGEMYLAKETSRPTFPGLEYFQQVGPIIDVAFDGLKSGVCTIDTVQVLLLYSFYFQVIDAASGHYLMSGVAMRSALVLEMHKCNRGKSISRSEMEHRNRLWWTLYVVDRYCCAKTGVPLSISDESITTDMPSDRGINNLPEACFLKSFIEISQISSTMVTDLYQAGRTQTDLVPVMLNLLSKIDTWRHNLPEKLKVDYNSQTLDTTRTLVNIHSKYFQCINLTIRPILLYYLRERLKGTTHLELSELPRDAVTLLTASQQASIQTLRSHGILDTRNEVARYGYLDREYIYSSLATLVIYSATFGIRSSVAIIINDGLTLLGNMKGSANNRREQVLQLIKTFEENGIQAHDFAIPNQTSEVQTQQQMVQTPTSSVPNSDPGSGFDLFQNEVFGPLLDENLLPTDFVWDEGWWNELGTQHVLTGNSNQQDSEKPTIYQFYENHNYGSLPGPSS